jgi:5-methylcytosine-specific restriction endonuclease McrA
MAACRDCGTTDETLHYRSGKMSRCHDCQHYANLMTKKTGGSVSFTREEFVEWRRASPERRRCTYCGIDSAQLYALNVINPRTKKRYEVVGVDRVDNAKAYDLENLVPSCPLCNQVKSQLLTYEEMASLGPHLRTFYDARLATAGSG